jgi:hypothetical protein
LVPPTSRAACCDRGATIASRYDIFRNNLCVVIAAPRGNCDAALSLFC